MWKRTSSAASKALYNTSRDTCSEDAKTLLVVFLFFAAKEKIPCDLLVRGSAPRKRWNNHGEMEDVPAVDIGLASEVISLLSDIMRMHDVLNELVALSAISEVTRHNYMVDNDIAARVREGLCPETIAFWREQVLIITFRAVLWKYIELAYVQPLSIYIILITAQRSKLSLLFAAAQICFGSL